MDSKKVISNRLNARRSTGPKTALGKSRSRLNAIKHGLFSRELPIAEVDRPNYELLRENLLIELKPNTTAQQIAFNNVVDCAWRRVLALRLEGKRIAAQLDDLTQSHTEDEKGKNSQNTIWFLASRGEIRNHIKELSQIEAELEGRGLLSEENREALTKIFGPALVVELDKWTPSMPLDAVQMAMMLSVKAKRFNMSLPMLDNAPEVVLDPQQAIQMRSKLLSERRHFLEDFLKFHEQSWAQDTSQSHTDFNPRFFATATRDLQRAFDWFLELRERGM